LAAQLLARYASQMGDPRLSVLLPFGKCYRALVRGKVYALRGQAGRSEAFRYFRYAHRMVWQSLPPHLIMVCGLTGSGKSTLARQLGERLGLTVINSDAVRKTIAGRLGRQNVPFEAGIYSPTMTERTYARMTRDADRLLQEGRAAILDATFLRKAHRQRIVKLADKHKVPLLVIHCAASESATEKRLSRRFAEGRDISDGRWEVFVEQKRIFEPLEDISPDSRLLVNTDAPLDQLTGDCEKFLRAQLAHHRGAGAEFG
jgi:predicted kinase